jgi:hypothetical protein
MLQGSLFADAMGRDIMPDMYLPPRRAGEGYARMFLRMLGADGAANRGNDAVENTKARKGRRSSTGERKRNGQGRHRSSGT